MGAGLGSLVALACALAWYALVPALVASSAAIVFLSAAGHQRRLSLAVLAALASVVLWAAFGTTAGYFRLNQHRLEKLVGDIQAVPAIISLELGHEDEVSRHDDVFLDEHGGDSSFVFDSYRFINGTVVTHFREQAAPEASQPVIYVDDMLWRLHVPTERYWRLRRSLERLSLSGYGRGPSGQVALYEPSVGGRPWGYGYVFSPTGEASWSNGMQEAWRLAPHWFYVLWG